MVIMFLVIAVAVTGCTSTSPSSSNTAQTSGAASTGAASSSTPQVGSTSSASSIFGTNYNWVEYKTTASYGGKEMTTDLKDVKSDGSYQGSPAIEVKATITTSTGSSIVDDIYWDPTMSTILGGTMTMTAANGQTITENITAAQLSQMKSTNFHSGTLTFVGVEPVTVPAGSYPVASKYTYVQSGSTGTGSTVWSAPGVPLPVKVAGTSSTGSFTMELVGWG